MTASLASFLGLLDLFVCAAIGPRRFYGYRYPLETPLSAVLRADGSSVRPAIKEIWAGVEQILDESVSRHSVKSYLHRGTYD